MTEEIKPRDIHAQENSDEIMRPAVAALSRPDGGLLILATRQPSE